MVLANIRRIILTSSLLLSAILWASVSAMYPQSNLQVIRLTQVFGLTALAYLYFTLLASPLCLVFPRLWGRAYYLRARKSLGVSAFFFAVIHSSLGFFGLLGGWQGIGFLSNRYLLAVGLGATALFILTVLAITSFARVKRALGWFWKPLHRLVYVAAVFTLLHVAMIGTHYRDGTRLIPQITLWAVLALLVLEARRLDLYFQRRFELKADYGPVVVFTVVIISSVLTTVYNPLSIFPSLNLHGEHSVDDPALSDTNTISAALYQRYSVSFIEPDLINKNEQTTLRFTIIDATTGDAVPVFTIVDDEAAQLVVVDDALASFERLSPHQEGSTLFAPVKFAHDGAYHLYLSFQPFDSIAQQFVFRVSVGSRFDLTTPLKALDAARERTQGNWTVRFDVPQRVSAEALNTNQQRIAFRLEDVQTHQPIKTIPPYLGGFGHVTFINRQTFESVVPASVLTVLEETQRGGPVVEFTLDPVLHPIRPGSYSVFFEYHDGVAVHVAHYILAVE